MSEQNNEQTDTPNLGTSALTGPVEDATTPPEIVHPSVVQNTPSEPSGVPISQVPQVDANASATRNDNPGEPLGANAPALSELQNQLCPNCHTGVLFVINYDPYATYEQGQGSALAAGHESGGSYTVECHHCTFTDSRALNPGKLWGR